MGRHLVWTFTLEMLENQRFWPMPMLAHLCGLQRVDHASIVGKCLPLGCMCHTTINICKPECFPERKQVHWLTWRSLKITQMSGKTPTVVPFLFTMQIVSWWSWMDLKTSDEPRVGDLRLKFGSEQVKLARDLVVSENSVPLHPMVNNHYPY